MTAHSAPIEYTNAPLTTIDEDLVNRLLALHREKHPSYAKNTAWLAGRKVGYESYPEMFPFDTLEGRPHLTHREYDRICIWMQNLDQKTNSYGKDELKDDIYRAYAEGLKMGVSERWAKINNTLIDQSSKDASELHRLEVSIYSTQSGLSRNLPEFYFPSNEGGYLSTPTRHMHHLSTISVARQRQIILADEMAKREIAEKVADGYSFEESCEKVQHRNGADWAIAKFWAKYGDVPVTREEIESRVSNIHVERRKSKFDALVPVTIKEETVPPQNKGIMEKLHSLLGMGREPQPRASTGLRM